MQEIEVGVAFNCGTLRLGYRLTGDLGRIRIPSQREGGRIDGLWMHTCLEAFIRVGHEPQYVELNFAPSRQWAAYLFDSYRQGMRPLKLSEPPGISVRRESAAAHPGAPSSVLELDALVNLHVLSRKTAQTLSVGLSAVVEDDGGDLSYWALSHVGDLPDFHDSATWALEIIRL